MKIIVIGSGYVGLVSGACLADIGIEVVCIDTNVEKIANLNKGILPIYEPGLEEIVQRNAAKGRLVFATDMAAHTAEVSAVIIAVGTPQGEDGSADLQYVLAAAKEIGQKLSGYAVVITKSTVPVGSYKLVREAVAQGLRAQQASFGFDIASNPEFLKEGAAIADFMSPDRIVVGVETPRAKAMLEQLYKPFLLNGFRILFMDLPSAEMTKYAANAMLATRISFMNEMANLCEEVGADINQVRQGIGTDPRIGKKFLYAGIGYGGSCFPKDVQALINTGRQYGHDLQLLQKVEEVNAHQKLRLYHKVTQYFGKDLSGLHFAVWGLSFKPQTDDMREAPSIYIINALVAAGATVAAYDPVAMPEAKKIWSHPNITFATDEYSVLKGSAALLLITEWREFRLPDWNKVKKVLKNNIIFDGRNIYNRAELTAAGFQYFGIGS